MSLLNTQVNDPFKDTGDDESQPANYIRRNKLLLIIDIRIQQRNGRKTLTTLQGLPQQYDQKRILKVLKKVGILFLRKDFACNGNIVKDDDLGEVIQLQGDQRTNIQEFLTTLLKIQKKNIKVHGF